MTGCTTWTTTTRYRPTEYLQAETFEWVFSGLDSNGIRVGYQKEVVDVVERNSGSFYTRAERCAKMDGMIGSIPIGNWEKIRVGAQEMEAADIRDYRPFGRDKPYRLVVSRIKRRDGQADLFSG